MEPELTCSLRVSTICPRNPESPHLSTRGESRDHRAPLPTQNGCPVGVGETGRQILAGRGILSGWGEVGRGQEQERAITEYTCSGQKWADTNIYSRNVTSPLLILYRRRQSQHF